MIKKYLKLIPRHIWILMLIIAVGVFLRTYHFSDWLVFNPDQARDAMLIEKALDASSDIPLLGPEAGNTGFQLGPIFYYFEYVSAKIFGDNPWVMAYPDLFFSILTIILFYFFSRRYFSINIALSITALLSVSYFAVRYSRFAMNTNSIPFFTLLFLFGLLSMLDLKRKNNYLWPIITGIALGIGIQLHALLLIGMPIMSLIVLVISIRRKLFSFKKLAIIVTLVIVLNLGEIIFDLKNNGFNSNLFVASVTQESGGGNLLRNFGINAAYQIQANMHMLSSLGNHNEPNFIKIANKVIKDKEPYSTYQGKIAVIFSMLVCLSFSFGGYFILVYYWKKETDQNKKDFLLLVSVYSAIIFAIMIPIITQASIRYFVVILFLPFIFLGLWIKYIISKNNKVGLASVIILFIFLILSNLYTIKNSAVNYFSKSVSDVDNAILGEIQPMEEYIVKHSKPFSEAYLIGKNFYTIRFYKPLLYLTRKNGLNLIRVESEKQIKPGIPVFYVQNSVSEIQNGSREQVFKGYQVTDAKKFNKIMILKLKN